ncbi:thioester reductase domain-containing protein [Embleya sp. NPDC005971]|uniref:thioester reductase domain-containing protein n=1 Tax=Embleya sp. NPDC005971 TaxID=3156724 RepID=UPI0033E2E3C5
MIREDGPGAARTGPVRRGADPGADALLDPDIAPTASPVSALGPAGSDRRVLLTGATGFLGAFLLRELLDRTGADVWCLVRADTPQHARHRLQQTMRRYLLWDTDTAARIVPIAGDLTRPRLGLTARQWSRLAERVDVVQHSGARVGHVARYESLRDANVLGTAEVLRLACADHVKPVHFVSTAALPTDPADPAGEPPRPGTAGAGYVLSKWVAERLVHQAGARGVPVAVYRPGRIGGHSVTGACQLDDAIWNFVRAVVLLGAAPEVTGSRVSFMPVDHVARAIVRGQAADAPAGPVRHLLDPSGMALRELLGYVAERFPVGLVPPEVWLTRLWDARHGYDGALTRASLLLASYRALLDGTAQPPVGNVGGSPGGAGGADVACPPMDGGSINAHLDYFESVGFLPSAAARFPA